MVTCRVAAAAVYDVAAENEGEGVDWSIRLSMSAHNINPSSIGDHITKSRNQTHFSFLYINIIIRRDRKRGTSLKHMPNVLYQ